MATTSAQRHGSREPEDRARKRTSHNAKAFLATVKVEGQVLETFSTKGGEAQGAAPRAHQDPEDPNRVWIIFDWDVDGLNSLKASPDAAELFNRPG